MESGQLITNRLLTPRYTRARKKNSYRRVACGVGKCGFAEDLVPRLFQYYDSRFACAVSVTRLVDAAATGFHRIDDPIRDLLMPTHRVQHPCH